MVAKGNPEKIKSVADLVAKNLTMVNRRMGTGTRQLFDKELKKQGIPGDTIKGYEACVSRHIDVGLSILTGKAHAGPGIRAAANSLGLDFIPLHWERFDLLISKDRFFDQGIQLFLSLLKGKVIQRAAEEYGGYDLSMTGKMVYPETDASAEGDQAGS